MTILSIPPLEKGDQGGFARGSGVTMMLHYNPRLKTKARSLRSNLTDAERRLWYRLRRKQILGVQFYRQKPVGNYIVDFYAPAVNLAIELDGSQHLDVTTAIKDKLRTTYLEQQGLKVLRFDDRQVLLQLESVLEKIYQVLKKPLLTSLCQREEPVRGVALGVGTR